jgi:hypothetical protein
MGSLINPQPITTFQQKIKDKKESIYFSHQRAPLGKSHDQTPGLPKGMDVINTTLGTPTIRGSKNKGQEEVGNTSYETGLNMSLIYFLLMM